MRYLLIFLVICGCASFELESPTGWKARYSRFWDQELSGVNFKMDNNGTVEGGIASQTSKQDETIKLLLQALIK